jgi:hypothetical protein
MPAVEPATLFRGTEFASVVLAVYGRRVSQQYTRTLLSPFVHSVISSTEPFEVPADLTGCDIDID